MGLTPLPYFRTLANIIVVIITIIMIKGRQVKIGIPVVEWSDVEEVEVFGLWRHNRYSYSWLFNNVL